MTTSPPRDRTAAPVPAPRDERVARITGTGGWSVTCYRDGERVEARLFGPRPKGPAPLGTARAFAPSRSGTLAG